MSRLRNPQEPDIGHGSQQVGILLLRVIHVFAEQHHVAAPVIGDQFRVNVLQLQSPDNRCLLPDRRICVPQVAVQVQDADHSRRHQYQNDQIRHPRPTAPPAQGILSFTPSAGRAVLAEPASLQVPVQPGRFISAGRRHMSQ